MAHRSEPQLLTVHALRIKGFAEPPIIADYYALEEVDVRTALDKAQAAGHVAYRDGRMSGFLLTPEGRVEGERMLAAELDDIGARDEVDGAYREFLSLNGELLQICTNWQMREVDGTPTLNDHTDADYDRFVLDQLIGLHDRMRPITASLRAVLLRLGGHGDRLRFALEQLLAGEHRYFTRPMFPSYHTIWFELHEDLLATLGIDRATEGST